MTRNGRASQRLVTRNARAWLEWRDGGDGLEGMERDWLEWVTRNGEGLVRKQLKKKIMKKKMGDPN